jgi:type III pantothenate kinase
MKNLLALDIGNTNITAGIFTGERLAARGKTPTHHSSLYGRFLKKLCRRAGLKSAEDINGVIIASVVPLALSRVLVELHRTFDCAIRIAGRDVIVPIRNRYRVKAEVGQDRLVNAYAAMKLYGAPAVIVDFGTAVTFDIISRKGEYLGGLILPGVEMSLSGLEKNTALLPRVELKAYSSIIGKDTAGSIRGGMLFGYGAMCDGLIAKYRSILGAKTKAVMTGGNAGLISRYAKSVQAVDEDLTLKGLYLIDRFDSAHGQP